MAKTCEERLFVVWRHPSRAPYVIGELSYDGSKYRFRYDENLRLARVAGFDPRDFALTSAFPELAGRSYESTTLFQVFASRLPDRRRPDYAEILHRFGLRPDSGPFEILAKTRGRLGTDELGVERELTLQGQLSREGLPDGDAQLPGDGTHSVSAMSFRCYVTGWRFHDGDRMLNQLAPGLQLQLKRDQGNPNDPNAIAVIGPGDRRLGYVPVRYSSHVARALSTGWCVEARLVALKPPPSSPQERAMIRVEISGRPSVETIRERLRKKRSNNQSFPTRLPDPFPGVDLEGNEPIVIGPAPGKVCYGCDQQIEVSETLAIELRYLSGTYWFHEECQKIWDEVRREPVSRLRA